MQFKSERGASPSIVRGLLCAGLFVAASCGGDVTGPAPAPSMQVVAGDYTAGGSFGALSFTTVSDGETTDWLSVGARLDLAMRADGTVTGTLFVPGGDEAGGDLDASMDGSWTLDGNTIRFAQTADTFVRDVAFTWTDGVLTGERTFGHVRVRVVLVRKPGQRPN